MMERATPPTRRVQVKRLPDRGSYDRSTVDAVLDEALICHLGFSVEGQPYVIPTIHARDGDRLYVHGSSASRMLRTLKAGVPACLTVTIVDGLVMARSAFHHSINYRSVMVLGTALEVTDPKEKLAALHAVTDHVAPGRWEEVRPPTPDELRQTTVLRMGLDEASAKIRSGPPVDDPADVPLPVWAGVVPLRQVASPPVAEERVPVGVAVPGYLRDYVRTP
jgi:nitroimidazol reductase NimA-like FMN-containing flavoprotein (pyridoxamine 5'-phosphate oxidase superfamily)